MRVRLYAEDADRIGSLSLDDWLEASGKVVLQARASDLEMRLGWFNSNNQRKDGAGGE